MSDTTFLAACRDFTYQLGGVGWEVREAPGAPMLYVARVVAPPPRSLSIMSAGGSPHEAAVRLIEDFVDYAKCPYCGRETALLEIFGDDTCPSITDTFCRYTYQPEQHRFVGCARARLRLVST